MAIGTDFEIQADKDIRHVSGSTVYTVLELHAWLQDLADASAPVGDDTLSILDVNPSKIDGPRDELVATRLNLLNGFNVDATAVQYLNFGSIKQDDGDQLYSGLKTIGTPLVAESPMYIVQDGSKISTEYWADGHIQIMVNVKNSGTFIDSGLVRVYCRKYGQTYADFEVDLSPGGETSAAITSSATQWTTLSEGECAALVADLAITPGDSSHDLGNGNGSKEYKGTLTLSNDMTVSQAAQVLQYLCREASAATINGESGWEYRALNAGYTPNSAAPFGNVAGGKWFVAQGWWLAGVLPADSQAYVLIAHDGTTQTPPNTIGITQTNLVVGDRVLIGRDDGVDGYVTDQYHLAAGNDTGESTIVIKETIAADTPAAGVVRIGTERYTYTSFADSTFSGVSPTLSDDYAEDTTAWTPFIDDEAAATSMSVSFIYDATFTARVRVRNGNAVTPIVPYESTFSVGTAGGSNTTLRTSDV